MEIRRLLRDESDSFFECRLRALKNAPTAFMSTYAQEKSEGPGKFASSFEPGANDRAIFGAVADGKVVATVGIMREDRVRTNHKATIWGVYVDEGFRGQGISGKLIDLAIAFAKNEMQGIRILGLSLEANNSSAEKIYSSRGFVKWGVEPMAMSHEGRFHDEAQMSLQI